MYEEFFRFRPFLDRNDINTDEIIPAKYLTEITREALGPPFAGGSGTRGFQCGERYRRTERGCLPGEFRLRFIPRTRTLGARGAGNQHRHSRKLRPHIPAEHVQLRYARGRD